jgi:hypothetical protein
MIKAKEKYETLQSICFLRDEPNKIYMPLTFPDKIYIVLNMNHFLKIFGALEKMQQQLVCILTWNRVIHLLKRWQE